MKNKNNRKRNKWIKTLIIRLPATLFYQLHKKKLQHGSSYNFLVVHALKQFLSKNSKK